MPGWELWESAAVGQCMTCDRGAGMVLVQGDVRICSTCVMEAGKERR